MPNSTFLPQSELLPTFYQTIEGFYPEIIPVENAYLNASDKNRFFTDYCSNKSDLSSILKYLQYNAVKLLLNNLVNNIKFINENTNRLQNFVLSDNHNNYDSLLEKLASIVFEPVLTAHPTEPFSNQALKVITTLHRHMEEHYPLFNKEIVKSMFHSLMDNSLVPMKKLSVEEEIANNITYFHHLYLTLPRIAENITAQFLKQNINFSPMDHTILKPRSWAGGDADGNSNITAATMLKAIEMQSQAVIKWHIDQLSKILSKQNLPESFYNDFDMLRANLHESYGSIDRLEKNFQDFMDMFESMIKRYSQLIDGSPLLKDMLNAFMLRLKTFKFYLAKIDARQNSQVYKEVYIALSKYFKTNINYHTILLDQKFRTQLRELFTNNAFAHYPLIHTEFNRLKIIAAFPDIFANLIISDTQSLDDILNPLALCKIFGANPIITPLFENSDSLADALDIMKAALSNPFYKESVASKPLKIMIGFSDSEKEFGIFILPLIRKAIQDLERFFTEKNAKYSIFYGNGLDLARGGPNTFALEQTIQGNHKRYIFSTLNNTLLYFYYTLNHALFNKVDRSIEKLVNLCTTPVKLYNSLFAASSALNLDSYLFEASPFRLLVKPNNFSSRPSNRSELKDDIPPFLPWLKSYDHPKIPVLEGIRAISLVNTIEGTFTNFNLWYGLKEFLISARQSNILEYLKGNFYACDLIMKSLIGLKSADFTAAKQFSPPEAIHPFLSFIEKRHEETQTLINAMHLKLPHQIISELTDKNDYITPIKHFISFACRNLVYQDINHSPKLLREVFKAELDDTDYLELIAKLFGAVYCGFTEYRTPPYHFLESGFAAFLQSNHLDNGKNKSHS